MVGTTQFERTLGEKENNIKKAKELLRDAASKGAKIISLPELFSTGYFPYGEVSDEYFSWAETIPGPTIDEMSELSKSLDIYLIAPIYEIEEVTLVHYNSAAIISPKKGLIGIMRKRHIPAVKPFMIEKYYYAPGNIKYPVFDVEGWKIAVSICYDRHFPETFKLSTLHGAQIVFSVNNTPTPRSEKMWFAEIEVAASSCGIFIVQNNVVGEAPGFFGKSFIANPRGDVICQLKSDEGILVVELDRLDLEQARTYYKPIWDTNWSDFGLSNEVTGHLLSEK
jgi:N-carbamoylputrescine amidase